MQETTLLGYCLKNNDSGDFIAADGAYTKSVMDEPAPVALAEAYRIIATYLTEHPESSPPEIVKVFRTRELTPLESTSRELGDLLINLTKRHGLDLGLSRKQVERKITQELVRFSSAQPMRILR